MHLQRHVGLPHLAQTATLGSLPLLGTFLGCYENPGWLKLAFWNKLLRGEIVEIDGSLGWAK